MSTGKPQPASSESTAAHNSPDSASKNENIPPKRMLLWMLMIVFITVAGTVILMSLDEDNGQAARPIPTPDSIDDIDWANSPPCSPDDLSEEWEEITDSRMRENSNRRKFRNKRTGAIINFDQGDANQTGERSKDHWHRDNPNKINKRNQYLDEKGNEVGRNSPESHITPKCD